MTRLVLAVLSAAVLLGCGVLWLSGWGVVL